VTFSEESQGQLAMVIYEWTDYRYLGKVTSETEDYLPVCGLPLTRSNNIHAVAVAENVHMHV
jgi:hypothetical protein